MKTLYPPAISKTQARRNRQREHLHRLNVKLWHKQYKTNRVIHCLSIHHIADIVRSLSNLINVPKSSILESICTLREPRDEAGRDPLLAVVSKDFITPSLCGVTVGRDRTPSVILYVEKPALDNVPHTHIQVLYPEAGALWKYNRFQEQRDARKDLFDDPPLVTKIGDQHYEAPDGRRFATIIAAAKHIIVGAIEARAHVRLPEKDAQAIARSLVIPSDGSADPALLNVVLALHNQLKEYGVI